MNLIKKLQGMMEYIWGGARRIFTPHQDDYPKTGVQPFEGDPDSSQELP